MSLVALAGCNQALVDGDFVGNASIRLQGTVGVPVGDPAHAMVGALWLGYSAVFNPTSGIETTTLPVTSVHFPPSFVCDVLGPPPSSGHYVTRDSRIIPSSLRFARLILFDDQDTDGRFDVDGGGHLVPPDRLLARAAGNLLLFVERSASDPAALDGADTLLTNWEAATAGYHIVELDPSVAPPDFSGHVVATNTSIVFVPPSTDALP